MILRHFFIACLVPLLLASQDPAAQNINGFKVFVSKHRVTTLYFHDPVTNYSFAEKTAPYKFEELMRSPNSIPLSVDKDVKEPFTLYVNEGSRQHKFIIIYKDVVEASEQDIYFSDLKVVAAIAKLEESQQASNSQVNAASQQSNEKKPAPIANGERNTASESLYSSYIDTYIKAADEAFNAKLYDVAQADYNDALNSEPTDTHAKNQLQKIQKIFEAGKNTAQTSANNNADTNRLDIKAAREIEASMVLIRSHLFKMGNDEGATDESPMHVVKIDSFYIGEFEVTQAQWQSIMGSNPSAFKNCEKCPVENISWSDAMTFTQKLNALTNKKYRLPTEAEWEYVASAQSFRKEKFENIGWYYGNSKRATHPAGQLKANFFGVYDIFGNITEWCSDWYSANAYKRDIQINPKGPATGKEKVTRGGAWYDMEGIFRYTYRDKELPNKASNKIGIRLAADLN